MKNSYCHQLMFGKFTEQALLAEVGCRTRRAFRARPGCSSNTTHPTVPLPFPKRSLIPTAHRIKSKSSCHFSLPQFCPPCAFRPSLQTPSRTLSSSDVYASLAYATTQSRGCFSFSLPWALLHAISPANTTPGDLCRPLLCASLRTHILHSLLPHPLLSHPLLQSRHSKGKGQVWYCLDSNTAFWAQELISKENQVLTNTWIHCLEVSAGLVSRVILRHWISYWTGTKSYIWASCLKKKKTNENVTFLFCKLH